MTNLVCDAYVVSRLSGSYAVYWSGCRSKSHGADCGEKDVRSHTALLLATEGGGELRAR